MYPICSYRTSRELNFFHPGVFVRIAGLLALRPLVPEDELAFLPGAKTGLNDMLPITKF